MGCGGHALSCISVVEEVGLIKIQGLIGLQSEVGLNINGYKVVGTDEDLDKLKLITDSVFLGIGQIKSAEIRRKIFNLYSAKGFNFPPLISTKTAISRDVHIGEGSQIMRGVIMNSGVEIGKNTILNTGAIIEHGVKVAEHCHVSTGSILNGGVRVGSGTFIGSNTVVRENVRIGQNCVIGMGISIRHDVKDCEVVLQ